jgi:hypothetical protein
MMMAFNFKKVEKHLNFSNCLTNKNQNKKESDVSGRTAHTHKITITIKNIELIFVLLFVLISLVIKTN